MKVLFIGPDYKPAMGGQGRLLEVLARGLEDDGHQVVARHLSAKTVNWLRGKQGIFVFLANFLFSVWASIRANAWAKAADADVILASGGPGGAFLLGQPTAAPLVFLANHTYADQARYLGNSLVYRLMGWCEKTTVHNASKVIAVSTATKTSVAHDYGVDREKIIVIPPTIEVDDFYPEPGVAPDSRKVLFVGRLDARKNVRALIEAFANLRAGSATLTIVGEGGEKEALQALAMKLGVESRVKWLGSLPYPELRREMQTAGVVVLPSKFEGYGMVLVEGLLSGANIVARIAPGMVDVLGRAPTRGFGFATDAEFPKRLQQAIDNRSTIRRGEQEIAAVRHAHAPETVARQHVAVYETASVQEYPRGVTASAIFLVAILMATIVGTRQEFAPSLLALSAVIAIVAACMIALVAAAIVPRTMAIGATILALLHLGLRVDSRFEPHYSMRDQAVYHLAGQKMATQGTSYWHGEHLATHLGLVPVDAATWLPQFLPGYQSYLAGFFVLFGDGWGANVANYFLGVVTLALLCLCARQIGGSRAAAVAPWLWVSSYFVLWTGRATYSENLFAVTILTAAFALMAIKHRPIAIALVGLATAVAVASRPEGRIMVLAVVVALIYAAWRSRATIKQQILGTLLFLGPFSVGFAIERWFAEQPMTSRIGDQQAGFIFVRILQDGAQAIMAGEFGEYLNSADPVHVGYFFSYTLESFLHYGFVPVLLLAPIGLLLAEKSDRVHVLLSLAPGLIFLFFPSIFPDHPWHIRRYAAGLWPLAVILASAAIVYLAKRTGRRHARITTFAFTSVLLVGLFLPALPLLAHVETGNGAEIALDLNEFLQDNMEPGAVLLTSQTANRWAPMVELEGNFQTIQTRDRAQTAALLANQTSAVYLLMEESTNLGQAQWRLGNFNPEFVDAIEIDYWTLQRGGLRDAQVFDNPLDYGYEHFERQLDSIPPSKFIQKNERLQLWQLTDPAP